MELTIEKIQECKELLLKDLCARLPYGVKCENHNHVYGKNIFKVTDIRDNGYICGIINNRNYWAVFDPLELKPYLFPLSSMTEEQKKEFDISMDMGYAAAYNAEINCANIMIDFFNKYHLDYRGLIPMGLAIDATGLNIY